MHIPTTIAALALLTAAMLLLRIYWTRIDFRLRFLLIRGSIGIITLHVFFAVSKWGTTSSYINVVINWLAIAGYELLVLLFTRLSPKWLTALSAVILIAPLFASSILLPLTRIFEPGTIPRVPIGDHLYYKVAPLECRWCRQLWCRPRNPFQPTFRSISKSQGPEPVVQHAGVQCLRVLCLTRTNSTHRYRSLPTLAQRTSRSRR